MVHDREGSTTVNIYIYTVLKFEFAVLLPCLKTNPPEHPNQVYDFQASNLTHVEGKIYQNEAIERKRKMLNLPLFIRRQISDKLRPVTRVPWFRSLHHHVVGCR
jgi:hypothetical protein